MSGLIDPAEKVPELEPNRGRKVQRGLPRTLEPAPRREPSSTSPRGGMSSRHLNSICDRCGRKSAPMGSGSGRTIGPSASRCSHHLFHSPAPATRTGVPTLRVRPLRFAPPLPVPSLPLQRWSSTSIAFLSRPPEAAVGRAFPVFSPGGGTRFPKGGEKTWSPRPPKKQSAGRVAR